MFSDMLWLRRGCYTLTLRRWWFSFRNSLFRKPLSLLRSLSFACSLAHSSTSQSVPERHLSSVSRVPKSEFQNIPSPLRKMRRSLHCPVIYFLHLCAIIFIYGNCRLYLQWWLLEWFERVCKRNRINRNNWVWTEETWREFDPNINLSHYLSPCRLNSHFHLHRFARMRFARGKVDTSRDPLKDQRLTREIRP